MFKTTEIMQEKECLMAKKYEAKKTTKNRRCLICGHEIYSYDWTYNLKLRNGETEYVHAHCWKMRPRGDFNTVRQTKSANHED